MQSIPGMATTRQCVSRIAQLEELGAHTCGVCSQLGCRDTQTERITPHLFEKFTNL